MNLSLKRISIPHLDVYSQPGGDYRVWPGYNHFLKQLPEGIPTVDFKLHAHNKPIDLLSSAITVSPYQWIVSKRLFELFMNYIGYDSDSTVARVFDKAGRGSLDYILLNYLGRISVSDVMNIDRCSAVKYDESTMKFEPYPIESWEKFKNDKALLKTFDLSDDVTKYHHWVMQGGNSYWMISDELAHALKEHKITGITIYDRGNDGFKARQLDLREAPIFYAG